MHRPFIEPRLFLLPLLAGLSGCGLFEDTTAEVRLTTNPPGAHCRLEGADGFVREVVTPVHLDMPLEASPVDVTCARSGYRPAHGQMEIAHHGWVMRNGAALASLGADGLALVGLDLGEDDAPGTTRPENDFSVPMAPIQRRELLLRQRDGGEEHIRPGEGASP